MLNIDIEGHNIQIRLDSSGSVDPWTLEYAHNSRIGLIVTDDIAEYILSDNDAIYRIDNGNANELNNTTSYQDLIQWLNINTKYRGSLETNIEILNTRRGK